MNRFGKFIQFDNDVETYFIADITSTMVTVPAMAIKDTHKRLITRFANIWQCDEGVLVVFVDS